MPHQPLKATATVHRLEKRVSRGPLGGLPGASSPTGESRKVTRILSRAHRHYEIAATIFPVHQAMHSCRPVLDTGAGINSVRRNVLPANWQSFHESIEQTPRIKDANNNRLVANYAVHLYIDVGCAKVFDRRFVLSPNAYRCHVSLVSSSWISMWRLSSHA